ncbi:hypothetical protein [Mesorhizobium sp. B2-8-9]|uniref:hypothetical protein n=1 Tax=Mesorhizobium sp. B2-8-9 TaxID=2589899 RepID=UPI0011286BDB|nr:hypothetical protein [Mesorhizobium sp. B2-8-9]TPI76252.1 hypothetical protein FJ423_21485 [Mesorhizobium sp. B2-8-9]
MAIMFATSRASVSKVRRMLQVSDKTSRSAGAAHPDYARIAPFAETGIAVRSVVAEEERQRN